MSALVAICESKYSARAVTCASVKPAFDRLRIAVADIGAKLMAPPVRRKNSPGAQILDRLVAAEEVEQEAQRLAARARQPRVAVEDQAGAVTGERDQLPVLRPIGEGARRPPR